MLPGNFGKPLKLNYSTKTQHSRNKLCYFLKVTILLKNTLETSTWAIVETQHLTMATEICIMSLAFVRASKLAVYSKHGSDIYENGLK